MDKKETLAYLTAQGIPYELTEHKAVYNMEELGDVALPYPEWDAKNLLSGTIKNGIITCLPSGETSGWT